MIAFLDGTIEQLEEDAVVIVVFGVGYRVFVPSTLLTMVQSGQTHRLYTYQHVREDAITLFGFLTDHDRKLFHRLMNASGVGPKLALQMLSHLSFSDLLKALRYEDLTLLKKVPGVGAKTAQRLVLELKDRLDDLWSIALSSGDTIEKPLNKLQSLSQLPPELGDVQEALVSLGYAEREVTPILQRITQELLALSLSEQVKTALRAMKS